MDRITTALVAFCLFTSTVLVTAVFIEDARREEAQWANIWRTK